MNKPISQKKFSSLANLLLLRPFFSPYKKEVFFALLALLITALTILFFGKAIKYLIDFGFLQKSGSYLNMILLASIAAVGAMAVAGYYRSSLINCVSDKVVADLQKKIFSHIINISSEFFETTKTGDIISRIIADTSVIHNTISNTVSFFLRNFLFFIGGICFLFFASAKLSMISMMIIPIAISPIIFMGRAIKNLSHRSQAATASIGAHIEEAMNGIKTIQAYLCEAKEAKNFSNFVDFSLKIALKKNHLKAFLIALVITFAFGGIAVVLCIGGHDVLNGSMTSGELSSFIFYSILTSTSLVSLSQIAGQLQTASAACGRIFEMLHVVSPVKQMAITKPFHSSENITIKLHNVNFTYPSRRDIFILKNFNLEIKPKEKIAIAGLSGAGKSTILQLLLRFYDVTSGSVLLNDIDIRSLSLSDLRKNFAYISQDCFIFSGTIFQNIAYVDKGLTEKHIQDIIAVNPALHFINHLPQKLQTFVGEKGIKLSGGERQRIAIARAIIKDSPILLFDEATSSLDNQNEEVITNAIADLSKNKTVITIAHRLSSIINCDRIIFIKDGEIAESGTHEELIALGGDYAKTYQREVE